MASLPERWEARKLAVSLQTDNKGWESCRGGGKARVQGPRQEGRLQYSPDLPHNLPSKPLQAAPQLFYLPPQRHQAGQHELQAVQYHLLSSWEAWEHCSITSLTRDCPQRPDWRTEDRRQRCPWARGTRRSCTQNSRTLTSHWSSIYKDLWGSDIHKSQVTNPEKKKKIKVPIFKRELSREFSSRLVAKTPCFHYQGSRFNPWLGD